MFKSPLEKTVGIFFREEAKIAEPTSAYYVDGLCYGFDCWFIGENRPNPIWWPLQLFFFPLFVLIYSIIFFITNFIPWLDQQVANLSQWFYE